MTSLPWKWFVVGNEVHFPAVGSLIGFSQTPQDRQNFLFDLIVASFLSGRQLHPGKCRWKRDREREGWGREGVSEREIRCQHSTISEEYFDVDSSVDYQHFTRVVKTKTAACRYVRFRWRTCFFFFFISSDFSVIIWGRRNGIEYHYFTESCPVRPPPLTPHFPYLFYMSLLSRRYIKISEITYANPLARARPHSRTHGRTRVRLYITGPVYRIITNTFTSLTLYCSVRFPGR